MIDACFEQRRSVHRSRGEAVSGINADSGASSAAGPHLRVPWQVQAAEADEDVKSVETRKFLKRSYTHRALFCLRPDNPLRRVCINVMHDKKWSRFILLVIILNSVALAVDNKTNRAQPGIASLLDTADILFISLFTFEMVMSIIARGFLFAGKRSYLRSAWNILDFVVVIFGLLQFVNGLPNVSYIRSLRLLRPLKAIKSIKGEQAA